MSASFSHIFSGESWLKRLRARFAKCLYQSQNPLLILQKLLLGFIKRDSVSDLPQSSIDTGIFVADVIAYVFGGVSLPQRKMWEGEYLNKSYNYGLIMFETDILLQIVLNVIQKKALPI